ncbi:MAG: hypothetical protein ACREFK_10495 [Stellaceae bacterium]
MSEESVTLELLGARVLTLTTEMRDVKLRLVALENRFTVMENRITGLDNRMSVLEERMSGVLAVVVNIAERLGGPSVDDRIAALEERVRSLEKQERL